MLISKNEISIRLADIRIRNELVPGDLGYIIHRHGKLYNEEYGYGISFEAYVTAGIAEFYRQYDPAKDRVWICEHQERIIGFLLLMHRPGPTAQLRFFYLEPAYRGIGLGKKLMELYMECLRAYGLNSSYLWTTDEQERASSLYKLYGFQLTEEKKSEAFGKPLTEQRYDFRAG